MPPHKIIGLVVQKEQPQVNDDEQKQTFRQQMAVIIMNQAAKGLRPGKPKGNAAQLEAFYDTFRPLAEWVADRMPKATSAAVGGVTLKCAILYGLDKAQKFIETLGKGTFNGTSDPCLLLWRALNKNRGKERVRDNYARAVCAARACCEGRTLRDLGKAKTDIFDWDDGLKTPQELEASVRNVLAQVKQAE